MRNSADRTEPAGQGERTQERFAGKVSGFIFVFPKLLNYKAALTEVA